MYKGPRGGRWNSSTILFGFEIVYSSFYFGMYSNICRGNYNDTSGKNSIIIDILFSIKR